MKIAALPIRTQADLERVFGRGFRQILQTARTSDRMQRLPRRVELHTAKPEFYLNDGDTLHSHAIDLRDMSTLASLYAGSGDSAANHPEQLRRGQHAPDGCAVLYVRSYWNGRNTSWELYVVSPNIAPPRELPAARAA